VIIRRSTYNPATVPSFAPALALVCLLAAAPWAVRAGAADDAVKHHSPFDLAYNATGNLVAVSDRTAGSLTILSPADARILKQVPLQGSPAGVAWLADGKGVLVAECGAGTVAEVDAAHGKVLRRFRTGPRPIGLAVAAKRGLLLVADSADDRLLVIDLATGQEKVRVALVREPYFLSVAPDESLAVVGNLLPAGDASQPAQCAAVSLVDLATLALLRHINLPVGATNVRKIVVSPDGRWAYVAHTIGRYTLPTTQLERGWMNTNAVTVLDLSAGKVYCTLLLDLITQGAAEPWGLALTSDGSTLFASLAGCHQVACLDLARLHQLLRSDEYVASGGQAAQGPSPLAAASEPGRTSAGARDQEAARKKSLAQLEPYRRNGVQNIWLEISQDITKRDLLIHDLAALHAGGVLSRTSLPGAMGPRGIAVSPNGKQLAVAVYFSGTVVLADAATPPGPPAGPPAAPAEAAVLVPTPAAMLEIAATVPLGKQPEPDEARTGEIIFHDATLCYQQWLSCAVCHPEGRSDGLNWDLLNDGIGNPKNTRSLLGAAQRAPMMAHGVRPSFETAVHAGFTSILFRQPGPSQTRAVEAYLRRLEPTPSPRLVEGQLSAKAKRGKLLFESDRTGCARCHRGPQLADLKTYDVGTGRDFDSSGHFVAPALVELWRTAPYLHDGSAPTMVDVLTRCNQAQKHGSTSTLSTGELEDLVEYLLSL